MLKAKEFKVEDSNVEGLGSDEDKALRKAAAQTEAAWKGAGQAVGTQIWRIEKFKVVSWPNDRYGEFFDGDSYIILHTYKKPDVEKLFWNIHFWLGKDTSQDEAGTAAYKTVELDDLLGTEPVQYRETQDNESDEFRQLMAQFGGIKYLSGGVDSGFKIVEPEKYEDRLLHIKGTLKTCVGTQVKKSHESMNSGDVFILDHGLTLYQWNGKKANATEKRKANEMCKEMKTQRKSKPVHITLEETEYNEDSVAFWTLLGLTHHKDLSLKNTTGGAVVLAEESGNDNEVAKKKAAAAHGKKLYHLSDASGKMEFKLVGDSAANNPVTMDKFNHDDVMILDSGNAIYVWIGKGANFDEKRAAMQKATEYMTHNNRPKTLPVCRVVDGKETEAFKKALHG